MSLKIETPPTRAQVEEMRARDDREMSQKLDEQRAALPFRLPPMNIDEAQRQKLVAKDWEIGKKIEEQREKKHQAILKREQRVRCIQEKLMHDAIAAIKALHG